MILSPTDSISLVGALVAAAFDVRTGKVPNLLTYGLVAAGVGLLVASAPLERSAALVGGLGAVALVFALYSHGLLGGGDAKLLVGLAFLQGYPMIVSTMFYAFFIGGIVAAVVLASRGRLWTFVGDLVHLREIRPSSEGPPLPFAAFVLAGNIASVLASGS